MRESEFQRKLISEIEELFPGCIVLKNDATYIQGIPDLLILFNNKWAALECKRSEKEHRQPNQEFYISKMDDMSFASFVYPENKEAVLHDLEYAFSSRRSTRLPRR